MQIRKGDNVIMLQGKDKTKKGKVIRVLKGIGKGGIMRHSVVVEGLNTVKKHQKPRQQGQTGQIITKERAVDASNVQIVCSKCGKPTRIAHQILESGKIRICKKCGAEL